MEVNPIWHDYPDLSKQLVQVNQVINTHIRIKDKKVRAIITEAINTGGKLLRPAYVLLCSNIGPDYDEDKSISIAASIETMHIATLVHDDVIDQADTRRGQATLHHLHDNKFAIYAGDYLFSASFAILSKHSSVLSIIPENIRSMQKILAGELDQLHSRFQPPNSVKSYLSRISGKTAQLFALSCYAGAVESGATKKQVRHAWNMGHYIGMAFQIIDDILDYHGDSDQLGKPILSDVQQGVYTLPLIYAMLDNPEAVSTMLAQERPFSPQTLLQLSRIIDTAKGVEQAQTIASRYTRKALKHLKKLPDGEYKESLHQLTTQLLLRTT